MYQPGLSGFGDITSDITDIIDAAAGAYKSITQPAAVGLPTVYQGPNINPLTGSYSPGNVYPYTTPTDYTIPLVIGGGLLLFLMTRGRR